MRLRHSLLALLVLAACSACSKPDIYVCSNEAGQVQEQDTPCAASHAHAANAGDDLTLLTRLPLAKLSAATKQRVTWLNWAFSNEQDVAYLRTADGDTGFLINGSGALYAVDLTTGKTLWRYAGDQPVVSLAVGKNQLFTLSNDHQRLLAHDRVTGKVVAQRDSAPLPNGLAQMSDPQWAGGVLIINENAIDLVALDPATLAERWRITPPSYDPYSLQVSGERILLNDNDHVVRAYDANTGQPLWQQALSDGELRVGSAIYYLDRLNAQVHTLDSKTGAVSATYHYDENDSITVDAAAHLLYKNIDWGAKLQAVDLDTGKDLWTYTLPEGLTTSDWQASAGNLLIFPSEHTRVLIVDRHSGTLTTTLHIPKMTFTLNRNERDTLLVGDGSLLIFQR